MTKEKEDFIIKYLKGLIGSGIFVIILLLVMISLYDRDELFQRGNRVKSEVVKKLNSSEENYAYSFNDFKFIFNDNKVTTDLNSQLPSDIHHYGKFNYINEKTKTHYVVNWEETMDGKISILKIKEE